MSIHSHLKLHLIRLAPLQSWNVPCEELVFVFPRAGLGDYCGTVAGANTTQPLASGDVLLLHTDSPGKVRAAGGVELVFCVFSLCIDHLVNLLMPDEVALVQPLMKSLRQPRLYASNSASALAWHRLIHDIAPRGDLEHRGRLFHLASAILSKEFDKLRPSLSRYERAGDHVTQLFEQLSLDEILNRSVKELARQFGCSQRHLNRLFNAHFGVSVGALRMEMRLLKAASLLRNGMLKILDVADQCGFNHLGLFNSCFRRRFGVSPGQWRRDVSLEGGFARSLVSAAPKCRLRESGLCLLSDCLTESGSQPVLVSGGAEMALPTAPLAGTSIRPQARVP